MIAVDQAGSIIRFVMCIFLCMIISAKALLTASCNVYLISFVNYARLQTVISYFVLIDESRRNCLRLSGGIINPPLFSRARPANVLSR